MAEVKDFLCLGQIQRTAIGMVSRAIADRDQELGAHIADKVQNADPLFSGEDAGIAGRGFPAGDVVKIVIGFRGPCAGYPDPGGTQLFGQTSQTVVIQVDGRVILRQIRHGGDIPEWADNRKLLCAGNLFRRIGIPECTAGYLGHLDVIGYETLIHIANQDRLVGAQHKRFTGS